MSKFMDELQLAVKSLVNKPSFSATVIFTMALTIGILIAAFNLNYLLLAKPLPFPNEARLVNVEIEQINQQTAKQFPHNTRVGLVELYKKQATLASLELIQQSRELLVSDGLQPKLNVAYVTPGYLDLLGVPIIKGRNMAVEEGLNKQIPVAVISYQTWQQWYNSDPDILGKMAQVSDVKYRIIGVIGENFVEYSPRPKEGKIEIWLPFDFNQLAQNDWSVGRSDLAAIGTLAPDVNVMQVNDSLTGSLLPKYEQDTATQAEFKDMTIKVTSTKLRDVIIGDSKSIGIIMFAGALILMLIACSNIINLFLSRTIEKTRTLAIQASLGAKPKHLFVAMFAESAILTFISALFGLIIAVWCFVLLEELAVDQLPRLSELSLDYVTVIFAMVTAFALASFFAFLSVRLIKYEKLKEQLQSSGKGGGLQISSTTRQILVISQVCLTSILISATLMLMHQTLDKVNNPLGFNQNNLFTLTLDGAQSYKTSEQEDGLLASVEQELNRLPYVENVSRAVHPPIRAGEWQMSLFDEKKNSLGAFPFNLIDENYFATIGQPILKGRGFEKNDKFVIKNRPIVLSESAAKLVFDTTDVVGRMVYTSRGEGREIVGVVGDIFNPYNSNDTKGIKIYTPFSNWKLNFIVKTNGKTISKHEALDILNKSAPGARIDEFDSIEGIYQKLLYKYKLIAWFVFVLSVLAIMLAAIGIYGVLSYSTQMRRFELGVRMSLGAKTHNLSRMVIKDNMKPILIGILLSIFVSFLIYLVAQEQLDVLLKPEVSVLALSMLLMVCVAFISCYIPVRKVLRERLISALRS